MSLIERSSSGIVGCEPFDSHRVNTVFPCGKPDAPENYQTVSVTLQENAEGTTIELSSDNNASEKEKEMTEQIWAYYFQGLKIMMDRK